MEAPQRSSAERNFARLLRHALTAPGEDTLYVVDGKPVMTFWGFTADAALPGVFLASPPVAPRPAVRAADARSRAGLGARRRRRRYALGVVAVAAAGACCCCCMLALLAWLVRPYLPHLEPYLEAEARDRALSLAVRQPLELQQTRVNTLQQDNENLRLELARLTDELSRRGGDCAAGIVGPGGVIVGAVHGRADRTRRRARRAAGRRRQRGRQGRRQGPGQGSGQGPRRQECRQGQRQGTRSARQDPQDKSNDKDKTAAAKDEPKPMVVPPEAKQKQDLAFLKGDWRSRTGLATATGERDIRPSYTLDDKGKGKVSLRAEERHHLRGAGRGALGRRQAGDRGKGQSQVRRRARPMPATRSIARSAPTAWPNATAASPATRAAITCRSAVESLDLAAQFHIVT